MAHPMVYPVHSAMTLEAASTIVDAALAAGRAAGCAPLVVAVVDAGGQLVAYKREDGAGLARFAIAMGKALAALGLGLPSREIGARNAERLAFLNAAAAATGGGFVPVAGGVLVMRDGRAIGAVGISGDTSDKDEAAAVAGITAAGLTPQAG
ncbi:GlcG/HbpS family heme-binding protein [Elioraea tepidiphila]|uniref:GlcG/HbpS family heme-binding protein n=1 Tax=Elioraea tepidiphila TaxID=457934 RepID=UPI000370EAC7|nr:heme-binding protein [Elioraea tepidiphila]